MANEDFVKVLVQIIDQVTKFSESIKPVIEQVTENPQLRSLINQGSTLYHSLPENVSFALTIGLAFLSTLLLMRVGRSMVSIFVILIQLGMVAGVAFVVWHLRDLLTSWLESILQ